MSRLMDRMLFHVQRLGRVGALGGALVASALVADVGLLQPMEGQLNTLVVDNQRAMLVPPEERRRPGAGEVGRTSLEPAADAALGRIFHAAEASGIELARGDYRLVKESGASHRAYQFTLPVVGAYPAIREFIAEVLADEPALALNSVILRRDSIETPDLEAVLRFTLYLEAGA